MMKLYSAGEIVKKLRGVTTRQILDIAEKGLIKPARDTGGAGSPRLYDFQNIFEICICLAVRGRIPVGDASHAFTTHILETIQEKTVEAYETAQQKCDILAKGPTPGGVTHPLVGGGPLKGDGCCKPPYDLLHIAYDDSNNYTFTLISHEMTLKQALKGSKKYRPQNYCTYILEVSALWDSLKKVF
jgi:hypothetical protein